MKSAGLTVSGGGSADSKVKGNGEPSGLEVCSKSCSLENPKSSVTWARPRSLNTLPGTGGVIRNSAAGVSNVTILQTPARDFSGGFEGNLNLWKSGTAGLFLHDTSGMSGTLTVSGGSLPLLDDGTFSGANEIRVRNAVLRWDDSGINLRTDRLSTSVPVRLDGVGRLSS
jgi:hypothetical protein